LSQHNNGDIPKWTSGFNDWIVIYQKESDNYTDARKWEIYLKKQKGGRGLEIILKDYDSSLSCP